MEGPEPQSNDIAKRLGMEERYQHVAALGRGGMGTVFLAFDKQLQKQVAIKLLHSNIDSRAIVRFQQEAKVLGKLNHQNIVRVMDFHYTTNDDLFMVMDYVDGSTIEETLERNGALSVENAIELCIQLADAMRHSHSKGVVHRDLKPSNVMIDQSGQARILDFGIAKVMESSELFGTMTRPGQAIGSPAYMSPEQLQGEPASERTDIYALGLMLYILVAGKSAFSEASIVASLNQRLSAEIPSLAEFVHSDSIAARIDEIVRKALAPQPVERYESMQDFHRALKETQSAIHKVNEPTARPQFYAMKPSLPVVLVLVAMCVSAAGVTLFLNSFLPTQEIKEYKSGETIGTDLYFKDIENLNGNLENRPPPPKGFAFPYQEEGTRYFWRPIEPINDEHISTLHRCRKQIDLSFADSKSVEPHHLRALRGVGVRAIDLKGTTNTGELLKELRSFPTLRFIRLNRTSLSDADLCKLGSLSGLTRLELHGCKNITDEGLRLICHNFPHLSILDVGKTGITGEGIVALNKLSVLRRLKLGALAISDKQASALSANQTLRFLFMVDSPCITDRILSLPLSLPKLEVFDVSNSQNITAPGVEQARKKTRCKIIFSQSEF